MRLSPASRAPSLFLLLILGLAPQALCCRPLRGLLQTSKPNRLYPVARFASFCKASKPNRLYLSPASRAFAKPQNRTNFICRSLRELLQIQNRKGTGFADVICIIPTFTTWRNASND
jgi:hypothetical protein